MAGIVEEIKRHVGLGQHVQAFVYRGWQRGGPWSARIGDVAGEGANQAAALADLSAKVTKVCERAYDKGYLVQHEDGSVTVCQWFGDTVSQTRVREGRIGCVSSGPWASPQEAAEAAVRPESYGPGVIVRL